jgi:hypothetical protein
MLAKPLLFLSSYCPLFALLAIRFTEIHLQLGCATLAVLGVISLLLLLRLDRHTAPGPHRLVSARPAGAEAASYLASYLLPFLTISDPSPRDIVAYLLFLIVAYAVYVQSSLGRVSKCVKPFVDGGEVDGGQVAHGEFVVAGG